MKCRVVEHKLSRSHTQGPQQLELVFRGQDKAILEHAFDVIPYRLAIIVEQHIRVERSGMVQVRSSAPKDGNQQRTRAASRSTNCTFQRAAQTRLD